MVKPTVTYKVAYTLNGRIRSECIDKEEVEDFIRECCDDTQNMVGVNHFEYKGVKARYVNMGNTVNITLIANERFYNPVLVYPDTKK